MKIIFRIIGGLLLLIVLLLAISAISNIGLPTESSVVEHLSDAEKARVAEMYHLRAELGNQVWPGWGTAEIPVILHNESYAFLIGYPGEPPKGWIKVPSNQQQGTAWGLVPDDSFFGQPYYRQPLQDENVTPENFTVRVGEHWVATFFTKEYAEIAFYDGFREELPVFLRPLLPYRLLWYLLMGSSDTYIEGMAHEAFHAFQGINRPERLATAEKVASEEHTYPWDDEALETAWEKELDLLLQAVKADSDQQAFELTRQFLEQRNERRAMQAFSQKYVDYERKREWLEGLAKYAELSLGLAAYHSEAYQPIPEVEADPDFKAYATQESYWNQQMDEIKRQSNQQGESRFYFSGMAQVVLLDRLWPGWKADSWDNEVGLDELLAKVVSLSN